MLLYVAALALPPQTAKSLTVSCCAVATLAAATSERHQKRILENRFRISRIYKLKTRKHVQRVLPLCTAPFASHTMHGTTELLLRIVYMVGIRKRTNRNRSVTDSNLFYMHQSWTTEFPEKRKTSAALTGSDTIGRADPEKTSARLKHSSRLNVMILKQFGAILCAGNKPCFSPPKGKLLCADRAAAASATCCQGRSTPAIASDPCLPYCNVLKRIDYSRTIFNGNEFRRRSRC